MYMYIYMYICRHPTYTTSSSPENMWNFPQKNNNISKFSVGKIMISPNCQPIRQFESSQNIHIQVSIEYDIYPDQVCRVNSINATVQQIYYISPVKFWVVCRNWLENVRILLVVAIPELLLWHLLRVNLHLVKCGITISQSVWVCARGRVCPRMASTKLHTLSLSHGI